jgi:tetratricopeptide (TPR) repeat protein
MMAGLLDVPVSVIRRWQRRGWLTPTREVCKLAYFDYPQLAAARPLAKLLSGGLSPRSLERRLDALLRNADGSSRPLASLSFVAQGRRLLLRDDRGLIEPGGQLQIDFDVEAAEEPSSEVAQRSLSDAPTVAPDDPVPILAFRRPGDTAPPSADQLIAAAADLADDGELADAEAAYRTALMTGGPRGDACFHLAELLYRQGELSAARERYSMAVELDDRFVEARANLGCVLAELGQYELAVAAFQGALACHEDYADVHYHLARTLDELSREEEADRHWHRFLDLAPDSPWSTEARQRLPR